MAVEVTVLGSCGAWPEPGRACSGFVVSAGGQRLVLDLGYGTLPSLLSLLGNEIANGLDAVVITHHHPDHMVDLHGLLRARWFGNRAATRLPLIAPEPVLQSLRNLENGRVDSLHHVFDWHPAPGGSVVVGPFTISTMRVPHFVPAMGVRVEAEGYVVAYTGDTGPSRVLVDLARDADLLIVEASDRYQRRPAPPSEPWPPLWLDSASAGVLAREAGVRRALLMHFEPGNDRQVTASNVARHYGGEILIADEGLTIPLA